MTTPGLFLIRDNIFGHLSFEDLETCCKVSDSWNESLNKSSSLNFGVFLSGTLPSYLFAKNCVVFDDQLISKKV